MGIGTSDDFVVNGEDVCGTYASFYTDDHNRAFGFKTTGLGGKKGGVEAYLRLVRDPEIFVVPLTDDEIREGYGQVLDRIVGPEEGKMEKKRGVR